MRVRFRPGFLLVTGETADEERALQSWASSYPQHAFALMVQDPHTIRLDSLGPKVEACREPINIVWATTPAPFNLISNLAPTPFELSGRHYGSIEAFWQGLKYPDEENRARIAPLDGLAARHVFFKMAARLAPFSAPCSQGRVIPNPDGSDSGRAACV